MEIHIRAATENDIAGILALWRELMLFHEPLDELFEMKEDAESQWASFLKSIFQRQKENKACIFLAETNSPTQTVGFITGMIEKNVPVFKLEEYGSIYDICVTEAFRRQEAGEKLVREAKKWYKALGIHRINVQVASNNPLSTSFWRKVGFTPFMEKLFFKEE